MLEIMHKVFIHNGEEWVVNTMAVLTSFPPQYNIYRISDGKHSYMFCDEANTKNAERYMSNAELFIMLNPNAKTEVFQNGNTTSSVTSYIINKEPERDPSLKRMTTEAAMYIESLRTKELPCTFRRVSELVAQKYPHLVPKDAVGHQWQGEELIDAAFRLLEGMEIIEAAKDPLLQHLLDKWYI